MFISNNCPSFHLWWKENLVKHRKTSKYYETDCRINCNKSIFGNDNKLVKKPNFMLNNILKVQENQPLAKKLWAFLHRVPSCKIYVITASMINRFEGNIALKNLDQEKYYIAVFASNI